jgi:hypothetical protein
VFRRIVCICCLFGCLASGRLASAQEFSADVVNTKDNGELKKLYAGKNKVRFEVESGGGMGPATVPVDESQNKYTLWLSLSGTCTWTPSR